MKTVEILASEAEDALLRLAGHVGRDVPIGRPLLARPDLDGDAGQGVQLLVDGGAVWWVFARGAVRVMALADGRLEVTTWRDGLERFRGITTLR